MTQDERALLAWADDEYVVAQQLVTLTGLWGPDMEEAVAIGSIAQDHLGQALNVYRHLREDDRAIDRLVYEREPAQYHSSLLADAWRPKEWVFLVVRHLLYDLANLERERWAATLGDEWRGLAAMMLRETELHVAHWTEWWRILAANERTRPEFLAALAELGAIAPDFFELPRDAGPGWSGREAAWRAAVQRLCAELGIATPALERKPPASGRRGEHLPELAGLLERAHAVYRTHPTWTWGP